MEAHWKTGLCGLEKDFFLVRFSQKEDYEKVLKDGPWFIGEHYLSIRKWKPNLKLATVSVSSIVVWVHLPQLPIEYYEPSVLRDIGQAIGPILTIDMHIATESKGRFARICVQINFDKLLIKLIRIGSIEQLVQYEGINSLCFSCSRVGHKMECCPYTTRAPERRDDDTVEGENSVAKDDSPSHEETYRPWVLVSRKKKVIRKERKGLAQPPSFSSGPLPRPQPTNHTKGPSSFWSISPGPAERDNS